MLEIVQEGHKALRTRSKELSKKEILSRETQTLIKQMIETLKAEPLGAALAAPQVGANVRIFVVVPEVIRKGDKDGTPLVCINPEIINRSKGKVDLHEGCLSLRGWWGYIPRSEKVTMRALDDRGNEFERGASGLLAQIFQHEIDHLDGILYIDNAYDMHTDAELKRREHTGTVKEARMKTRERINQE
jgi:peptide deformylase